MAQAGKRAGRETTEGLVGYILDGQVASIVGIGCETEPVSKNDEFQGFGHRVLKAIHEEGPEAAERFEDERVELVLKLGENIVSSSPARFEAPEGNVLAGYAPAREQDRRPRRARGAARPSWRGRSQCTSLVRGAGVDDPRRRPGGRRREGALDLPELGRGPVEARGRA